MVKQTILCDKCKVKIHRAVFVNGSEYCAPCALATISDFIRSGYVIINVSSEKGGEDD